ncbi:MAG: glycosyl transferase family 1 [Chitinophagia bacterium]|nr:glycosyl transferase family 1 [Chitinophagia bacterium]
MAATSPLLVMRFSALGDVAMTVPVLRLLLQQNASLHVRMVSNNAYAPLFAGIDRLTFTGADLQGKHRGLFGIITLFWALRKLGPYSGVADLHNVIRSRIVGFLFYLSGVPVVSLNKGRTQKRQLTRRHDKQLVQLPSGFERMQDVFDALGLSCALEKKPAGRVTSLSIPTSRYTIGIAPFAKHREKTYPFAAIKKVIALLHSDQRFVIRLFGGGAAEAAALAECEKEFSGVISMAGRHGLANELSAIAELDLMISMDSANMHLASLYNVPVLSIWGATHPYAGFMGWGQPLEHAIQVDLPCRPCSVFGNKTCYRCDWACLQQIEPTMIVNKVYQLLALSTH